MRRRPRCRRTSSRRSGLPISQSSPERRAAGFAATNRSPGRPANRDGAAADTVRTEAGGWRISHAIWTRYPSHSTCSGTCEEGDYVPPINWIRNLVSHLLSGYEGLRICEPAVEVGRGPADAGVLEGG